MLSNLTYELSVLAKSVQHKNLSAAAAHVGLSQPQLSRVVSKIESELGVILLDRTARRKSGWTPLAQDLALTFNRGMTRLQSDITSLAKDMEVSELHIGTLEGLSSIALQFVKQAYDKLNMKTIFLDVLDFRDLDSQFLEGQLDLIFTVRSPSKQKHQHLLEVGYQQMEQIHTNKQTWVISPYEHAAADRKSLEESKVFVSNSLSMRKGWFEEHGGYGIMPVEAKKGKGRGHYTIYLIGSDLISPPLWSQIETLF